MYSSGAMERLGRKLTPLFIFSFLNLDSPSNTSSPVQGHTWLTKYIITILSITVPLVVICFLMLLIFCCYHHRNNNNSHLSTCSSTSTSIKKSSHLINTVTSSPFRPSITANVNKPNPRYIPSSSSSTNTNFTNIFYPLKK